MKCEVFLESYPERLAGVKLEYGECFWVCDVFGGSKKD